jgi:hypothetical protein
LHEGSVGFKAMIDSTKKSASGWCPFYVKYVDLVPPRQMYNYVYGKWGKADRDSIPVKVQKLL